MHGHDQVAFVAGETGSAEPEERELGWRDAHRALGRVPGPVARTAFSLDGGYEATRQMLRSSNQPRAIFAGSDELAYGALHAIHDHQLRVPDDVAVVSFDGTTGSAHSWPPLTVAQQPLREMADAAVSSISAAVRLPTP